MSKQLSITIPDDLWDQMESDMKNLQKYNTSQYIQKAVLAFLERGKFEELLIKAKVEAYKECFVSDEAENWFSKMLDRELLKRAIIKPSNEK